MAPVRLLKDTAIRFEDRFGFPIRHGYGLSETTCYSCFLPNDFHAIATSSLAQDYDFPRSEFRCDIAKWRFLAGTEIGA